MEKLHEVLEGVKTVAIAGHVRPDGDCVGSCLAVYNYISENYPQIQADIYLEPIPNIFKFLKNSDKISHDCSRDQIYDLFIAQDCGDLRRLGDAAGYFSSARRTVCIDHHKSNDAFADINYVDPVASSTSELIFRLTDPERISRATAECIYLGIVHDTGVFQYSCTSPETMNVAGQLMAKGIDYPSIINDTFFEKTYEQTKILGVALEKSCLCMDGRCIWSIISGEEMEQYHVLPKHLEGIVSQLRSVKGVDTSVFLYQTDKAEWKVSMRSSKITDVAVIAQKFGGGGHARAAGVTMEGSPQEILDHLLKEIGKQLESANV